LAELAQLLRKKGLEIVGTELEREAEFGDGLSVVGRLDLIVRHPSKGMGVIDLKWTKSAKRRRTELADGRALQLATYGAIAQPDGDTTVPGAYYLLNQRRLIGPTGSHVADEEIDASRSLADTWTSLAETWRIWRNLAAQGSLLSTGPAEAVDHLPAGLGIAHAAEPCSYCELTTLCRVTQEAN
jgi:ATP-dependent helicase/nuclease subunit B